MMAADVGKVFDWTIEADREEYKRIVEENERAARLHPPQDRRSKIIRQWLKDHPEIRNQYPEILP